MRLVGGQENEMIWERVWGVGSLGSVHGASSYERRTIRSIVRWVSACSRGVRVWVRWGGGVRLMKMILDGDGGWGPCGPGGDSGIGVLVASGVCRWGSWGLRSGGSGSVYVGSFCWLWSAREMFSRWVLLSCVGLLR